MKDVMTREEIAAGVFFRLVTSSPLGHSPEYLARLAYEYADAFLHEGQDWCADPEFPEGVE